MRASGGQAISLPYNEEFAAGASGWGRLIACQLLIFCLLPLISCGYHVSGRGDLLPKNIHTIAIPAFGNATSQYKLSEQVTSAITREFISRTRYRVVADPAQAEALLTGSVVNFFYSPTVYDPAKNRASGAQILVVLQVKLTDSSNGAILFNRPNFEFRERYEISVDSRTYFEESGPAMERLSRNVARSVVSAVMEKF